MSDHRRPMERLRNVGEVFDELPECEKIKIARENRERRKYGTSYRQRNSARTGRRTS